MPRERGDLLKDLMNGVFLMDEELAVKAAKETVDAGYDASDAINNGLVAGMNKAGVLYEKEEYLPLQQNLWVHSGSGKSPSV